MRQNLFFFTKGYKAINPYRILFFYFLTFTYLLLQITLLYLEVFNFYGGYTFQDYLHGGGIDWIDRYYYVRY